MAEIKFFGAKKKDPQAAPTTNQNTSASRAKPSPAAPKSQFPQLKPAGNIAPAQDPEKILALIKQQQKQPPQMPAPQNAHAIEKPAVPSAPAVEEAPVIAPKEVSTLDPVPVPALQPKRAARSEDHIPGNMDARVRSFVDMISHEKDHAIYPHINYETNKVTYPLLSRIGESEDNLSLLDKLSSDSIGVLDKQIFERLVLCPEHSDSYAISLRLYCAKCNGMDIEKLHLIEHRACGYIGKKSEFDIATPPKCPSCRNVIKDVSKELRIPGMWYECNGCKSKFDNPTMKLHCRKYNHDFNMNQADTLTIPFYALRKQATTSKISILSIIPMIKKVLTARDFVVEETAQIKGKSGVSHTTSLYAYNRENKTVIVDIRSAETEIDDAEVISSFVKVIDINPDIAFFIAMPDISEKAKAMSGAGAYNKINIVSSRNFADIVKAVEQILTKQLPSPAEAAPRTESLPSSAPASSSYSGPKRIE